MNYFNEMKKELNLDNDKLLLYDEARTVITTLGIDLSNLDTISNERIRNLNYLMTMDNFKTESHKTLIQFANSFLGNKELSTDSNKAIKKQVYRPLESNNALDMY